MSIAEKKLSKEQMASASRKMSVCVEDLSHLHNLAALRPPQKANLEKAGSFRGMKRSNSILSSMTRPMSTY